ncbi:MAG: hypothetical protein WB679_07985 [Terracidiphilus sp.]
MAVVAATPTVIINNFNVFEAIVPLTTSGSYTTGGGDTLNLIGIVPSNSVPIYVDIQEMPPVGTVASGLEFRFAVGTTQANGKMQVFQTSGSNAATTLSIGAGTPATYPVGTAANTGSTTLVATGAVTVPLTAPAFTGTVSELGSVTYASVNVANLVARVVYKKYV